MDRGISMSTPASRLGMVLGGWLVVLAGNGCGGSSGASLKRLDASVRDSARDVPLATDTGASPIDGAGTVDGARDLVASIDVASRPDIAFNLPEVGDGCRVNITPASTTSLLDLIAGPTAVARVQGTIVWGQTQPFVPEWSWLVVRSDGHSITPTTVELDPSQVQFPTSIAARYDIAVSIGQGCVGATHALAAPPPNDYRLYRLRVLPPIDSALGAVPYEVDLKIEAGGRPVDKDVNLASGVPVTFDPSTGPTSPLALAVPSYLRIQSNGSTWTIYGRSSSQSPFRALLDPQLDYQVLVVPDASILDSQPWPPFLLNKSTSNGQRIDATYLAFAADPLALPRGIEISGRLSSPDGTVEGATISLHAYQSSNIVEQAPVLFSTVGRADGYGAYRLWVNPAGLFSVVVTPPQGSLLPIATIDQGIVLDEATGPIPSLDFSWAQLASTTLDVAVRLPDGTPAPSGIAVSLEAETGQLATVGTLTLASAGIDGGTTGFTAPATGLLRRDATTDRDGHVAFASLPKARYRFMLVPPSTLPSVAVTTVVVDATAANDTMQTTIQLATKVVALGRLLNAGDNGASNSAGATIVATDLGHDSTPPVVTSTVAGDGSFYLLLDPHRTYRLVAQPAQGRGLPSYVPLYGFSTGAANTLLDDQRLPMGVLVRGHVSFGGQAVVGAVVQVFCIGLPPDCVDRTNLAAGSPPAYASVITDVNGGYGLYLPDPATIE
jgi:hypothetical protein